MTVKRKELKELEELIEFSDRRRVGRSAKRDAAALLAALSKVLPLNRQSDAEYSARVRSERLEDPMRGGLP